MINVKKSLNCDYFLKRKSQKIWERIVPGNVRGECQIKCVGANISKALTFREKIKSVMKNDGFLLSLFF